MKIKCYRERGPSRTHGKLYVNGGYFCFTLEDVDRRLENGGSKVPGETAIPAGIYKVTLENSPRFGRDTLTLSSFGVAPGTILCLGKEVFTGVRVHGGNKVVDTHGCPLVGRVRTDIGIASCADVLADLKRVVRTALAAGEEVTWEVV